MKKKHKKVLSISVLCVIILAGFIAINSLFQPIWYTWGTIYTAREFYEEPENRIETVIVGPSVTVSGVIPMEMYDDYGICAYNLSSVKQPTMGSYYWVQEAYRLHPETLKTVVMDVSSMRSTAVESYYHKCFDYMRMSEVKFNAIKDYADGDKKKMIEFLLPIAAYHDRWNALEDNDLKYYVDDLLTGQRGYFYADTNITELSEHMFEPVPVEEARISSSVLNDEATAGTDKFVASSMEYFYKLVDFCKEHDIKLVLTKMPTIRWTSGLHNQVQEIADECELDFVDFNFSPLYDELNYVYPFDSFDAYHMNYYGAHKVTELLGEYLVEECDATDIRGLEEYDYMKAQSAEYNIRFSQPIELQSKETVTEYLSDAINEDNTVFIMAKDSASGALTDKQRSYFSEVGLEELSGIGIQDSYLAVIDKGEVTYEKINQIGKKGKNDLISKTGAVRKGDYNIASGRSAGHGLASCKIRNKEYAANTRGLNIVVYSNSVGQVVDSAVFDTEATLSRDTYSLEKAAEVAKLPSDADIDPKSITGQVMTYMQREKEYLAAEKLRKSVGKHDIAAFLDTYMSDSDNLIILSCKNDISKKLNAQERAELSSLGLSKLANIGYGDSYVAIIDGGSVQKEVSREGGKDITIDKLGLYIRSAGMYSGAASSILINGIEYASAENGLSVVVYDQAVNRVIDDINY